MGRKGTSRNGHSGRPTKFDLRRVKRILRALELGQPKRRAALAGGITYGCFRDWFVKGKYDVEHGKRTTEYAKFFIGVKEALAKGEYANAGTINRASKKNWQAAAWWLERIFPNTWARKEAVAIMGRNVNLNLEGGAQLKTREELIAETKEYLRMLEGTKGIESNGHTNGSERG